MGDDMTDEKIKDIFQRCYNKFWCKWREVPLTNDSPEWDEIVKEYGEIRKTFDCELCNHNVGPFGRTGQQKQGERGEK